MNTVGPAVAIAACLVLAGCGGDQRMSAPTPATPAQSATQAPTPEAPRRQQPAHITAARPPPAAEEVRDRMEEAMENLDEATRAELERIDGEIARERERWEANLRDGKIVWGSSMLFWEAIGARRSIIDWNLLALKTLAEIGAAARTNEQIQMAQVNSAPDAEAAGRAQEEADKSRAAADACSAELERRRGAVVEDIIDFRVNVWEAATQHTGPARALGGKMDILIQFFEGFAGHWLHDKEVQANGLCVP